VQLCTASAQLHLAGGRSRNSRWWHKLLNTMRVHVSSCTCPCQPVCTISKQPVTHFLPTPFHPCRPLLLHPYTCRCINTYSCTFFTRTPKGLCWLKNALGWSIRAQKDACPDITCTEGLDVGTLHPDDTSEDEAGPVPAASPASGSGRRLRGQPCLACQDATPTQTSSSDEENSTPNTGSGANSGNSSVPNTPTAEPTPAPGNEEEDPAPPTTCQRWVSGNVRNSKLPGYTSYCNIGGDFGDFGR
jgi:hypothetical protein